MPPETTNPTTTNPFRCNLRVDNPWVAPGSTALITWIAQQRAYQAYIGTPVEATLHDNHGNTKVLDLGIDYEIADLYDSTGALL